MGEYRKEVLKAVTMVLLVVLLGCVIYCSFPPEPPSPVAFALVWAGEQSKAPDEYEEKTYTYAFTMSYDLLEFEFGFTNGSWTGYSRLTHINESYSERYLRDRKELSQIDWLGYKGEFDAKGLKSIVVRPFPLMAWNAWEARTLNMTYTIETIRDYTLNVALETAETTDLGTYHNLNNNNTQVGTGENCTWIEHRGDELWSGYWTPPRAFTYIRDNKTTILNDWVINATQLTSMLKGAGTASITFDLRLNVNIKYNMTVAGISEIGEKSLLGEGRLGSIKIGYDQGEILWVNYNFTNVCLILLTGHQYFLEPH